ncbi:hypothetical protein BHYA_0060g00160 [Botrytis hyacinthi]|uniref:Uncharacterized protein n=1 Tax=Botrytis hyacinthi TaxID=278943 RepID=A0A4Z1GQT9_9HELO|nr:hypothetical protein BHYA_0060g00160 [Botrytis hyacinthi]
MEFLEVMYPSSSIIKDMRSKGPNIRDVVYDDPVNFPVYFRSPLQQLVVFQSFSTSFRASTKDRRYSAYALISEVFDPSWVAFSFPRLPILPNNDISGVVEDRQLQIIDRSSGTSFGNKVNVVRDVEVLGCLVMGFFDLAIFVV